MPPPPLHLPPPHLRRLAQRRCSALPPALTLPEDSAPTLRMAQTSPALEGLRKPQKRALLIGIQTCKGSEYPPLKAARADVKKMRALLIDVFGYKPDDITVLVDGGLKRHSQPTRVNILHAIDELVRDVQPGDRVFFHYSGHSTQIPNRNHTEDDGMDECIVPQDGEKYMIVDNELHRRLITPLPTGSSLVAVLDTCHSGSLLDLRHYRCNRVVVPWKWRGRHNSQDVDMRYNIIRRNANMSPDSIPMPSQTIPPPAPASHAASSARAGPRANVRRSEVFEPVPPSRTATLASQVAKVVPCLPQLHVQTQPLAPAFSRILEDEERFYTDSPVAEFCTGWCRQTKPEMAGDSATPPVRADVVSLASCKDSQQAWESADGLSMTSCLVELLRSRCGDMPTLEEVLCLISHATYKIAFERHESNKHYRLSRREWFAKAWRIIRGRERKAAPAVHDHRTVSRSPTEQRLRSAISKSERETGGDMDAFQNPEMASAVPLDMERKWCM
ncbi:Metacaspase pca1 [Mycena indigotica]|uniref:Metacaspase pca1 n=1 Tax=Mycena indigotica TaxID=2126181 RepID=A0A8H6WF70_9AGAR|nr:Metacaspase pca1 [Mycena indigotica]KAF7310224.1 Metacaspase pca1 [Mycena indigotica]